MSQAQSNVQYSQEVFNKSLEGKEALAIAEVLAGQVLPSQAQLLQQRLNIPRVEGGNSDWTYYKIPTGNLNVIRTGENIQYVFSRDGKETAVLKGQIQGYVPPTTTQTQNIPAQTIQGKTLPVMTGGVITSAPKVTE